MLRFRDAAWRQAGTFIQIENRVIGKGHFYILVTKKEYLTVLGVFQAIPGFRARNMPSLKDKLKTWI